MQIRTLIIMGITILFVLTGCGGNSSVDGFITVDVTKDYSPGKELVLQDFMDVEYIPLETTDEFIHQSFVQYIGEKYIIVKETSKDDIFIYDRNGKALRKINQKGNSGEEYIGCYSVTLDEAKEEMFVNDIYGLKILVYDLQGNFKRSFKHRTDNGSLFYMDIFNYDEDHLICYDKQNKTVPFIIISKQDGSVTREISVPFSKRIYMLLEKRDGEMVYTMSPGPYRTIIPDQGTWRLLEVSSDTIYTLKPDFSLQPFIVRTPPIQTMDSGVFLLIRMLSDRYIFMEAVESI